MSNKHIELVKKWLEADASAAYAARDADASAAYAARDADASAAYAAIAAAYAADDDVDGSDAKYWVAKYKEITNEK